MTRLGQLNQFTPKKLRKIQKRNYLKLVIKDNSMKYKTGHNVKNVECGEKQDIKWRKTSISTVKISKETATKNRRSVKTT